MFKSSDLVVVAIPLLTWTYCLSLNKAKTLCLQITVVIEFFELNLKLDFTAKTTPKFHSFIVTSQYQANYFKRFDRYFRAKVNAGESL